MPPPHHHHHHGPGHHHHPSPPDPVAEELRKLLHHQRLTSLAEMFNYISRRLGAETATKIRNSLSDYGAPSLEDAVQFVDAALRLLAGAKRQEILSAAADNGVALVFPLPPHIHEPFIRLSGARVLVPDGHELPPHLHDIQAPVIEGTRNCRRSIRGVQFIIAEGYRDDGVIIGDVEVVDIVHRDCIDPHAVVNAHLRPHHHHGDVPFALDADRLGLL